MKAARAPQYKYSPHLPTPRQQLFLDTLRQANTFEPGAAIEALYGGAAGGGKSDALLMAALEYVHVKDYAALILRRSYADLTLPGAIMDRGNEWLRGSDGKPHDGGIKWTFPGGGSLTFSYLANENDKFRYQGAAFQFIGFDELTQFTETQYRYMLSRVRRPSTGPLSYVPLRVAGASNPGGEGHDWVRARFLTEGRPFIPAKLSDNPHLDQKAYRAQLEKLDPVLRAQLLDGDWDVIPKGPMFDRQWFKIADAPPPPRASMMWRYWDLAGTKPKPGKDPDYTAGALLALHEGQWYICDMLRFRETPMNVEAIIRQTAEIDGHDVPIAIEQEPGSSGVAVVEHYQRRVLVGWTCYGDKKTGNKIDYARALSSAAQAGNVHLVRGAWNGAFLDECCAFPLVGHDDQVDAASGALRFLADGWQSADPMATLGGRRFSVPLRTGDEEDSDDNYKPINKRGF